MRYFDVSSKKNFPVDIYNKRIFAPIGGKTILKFSIFGLKVWKTVIFNRKSIWYILSKAAC